jgi:hypothetical protein
MKSIIQWLIIIIIRMYTNVNKDAWYRKSAKILKYFKKQG